LESEQLVFLQVHQYLGKVQTALMELPDEVGPNVRRRGQDP
jgi:hypothetical protein